MRQADQRIVDKPLASAVARFGVPLALGMGLQTSFNLVDVYILAGLGGHAGSVALGAIAIADLIAAIGAILSYGLSVATGALLSRRQGEGDSEGVRRVAWQSVLLVLLVSGAFAVVGGLGAKFLMVDVSGAKGEVARLGTQFLRVMSLGSATIFLLLHMLTIQRALGSSRSPIGLLVLGNVLNFVLAVLFVYGQGAAPSPFSWGPPLARSLGIPRLGLLGAAWATVLARLLVLLPMFYICQKRFGLFGREARTRPDKALLRQIVRIGWPTSSQLVLRVLAVFMVVALAQRLYTSDADQSLSTALGLVLRLETLALYVSLGWGSAAQTFVGQNLGASEVQRATQSGWYAALYNTLMMGAFAWLCVAFGEDFIRFFDETPEVVMQGTRYLRVVAPCYVALGIGIVLGSAVQGAGATRVTLLLDAMVVLCVQLPLCVVVYHLRLGAGALWGAVALTYVLFAIAYLIYYPRGRFVHQRLD